MKKHKRNLENGPRMVFLYSPEDHFTNELLTIIFPDQDGDFDDHDIYNGEEALELYRNYIEENSYLH